MTPTLQFLPASTPKQKALARELPGSSSSRVSATSSLPIGYRTDEIDLEAIDADQRWRDRQRRRQDWHYQQYGTYGD